MTIVVTGATGHLGRLVVESLLDRGVAPGDIVATGRSTDKIADLADRGVQVRHADFADPASLTDAFAGGERLLLVSGSEVGQRVQQHTNAVAAAVAAGVSLLAYTSIAGRGLHTDAAGGRASGDRGGHPRVRPAIRVPAQQLVPGELHRSDRGCAEERRDSRSAGDGLISGATRADYASAAAAVLAEDGHAGAYELGGDEAFTMSQFAAQLSSRGGKTVVYQDLPVQEYAAVLTSFGVPEAAAAVYADADAGVARGDLHVTTGDLSRLSGRPTTSLADAVADALD